MFGAVCRRDLVGIAAGARDKVPRDGLDGEHGGTGSSGGWAMRAAELGVASGAFSTAMLQAGVGELYSIDAWHDESRAHTAAEYFRVVSALRSFGPRSVVLRATFDEALPLFPGHLRMCAFECPKAGLRPGFRRPAT